MHKDANLRKRNALVIPGGLLAVHGLFGMVYAAALRTDDGTCGDASLMVFFGVCRSAILVMAIPVVIGLALAAIGAFVFRSRATCRHGHGSWTHFGLALLVSMVVVPVAGIGLVPSFLGEGATLVVDGVSYPWTSIFAGLTVVGVVALVPFAFLYAGQVRANPCCREKSCFTPCFCDEALGEAPPAEPAAAPAAPLADEWKVVEEPKPAAPPSAPPPAPAPPPEPATPSPPATPPVPAPAPKASSRGAPPLATRPSDPAAPPADEMAAAAQWAQDGDGGEDDEEPEPVGGGKAAPRRRGPAKAASRPKAKGAKPSKKKT